VKLKFIHLNQLADKKFWIAQNQFNANKAENFQITTEKVIEGPSELVKKQIKAWSGDDSERKQERQ
jgi:hypothetical protein